VYVKKNRNATLRGAIHAAGREEETKWSKIRLVRKPGKGRGPRAGKPPKEAITGKTRKPTSGC